MLKTCNKNRLFLFFFFITLNSVLHAQSLNVEFNSLAGSKSQLPFWLWANQLGRYDQNNSSVQHLGLSAYNKFQINSPLSIETGTDVDFLVDNSTTLRITQLYGKVNWKSASLQIGLFPDKELYGGLSTTNGNLSASRNSRPHPRIRLGINRFIPLFFDWFAIRVFYEEGLLNDNHRYVKDTHLHRKAFFLRFGKPSGLQVIAGGEHFVMWGGTHPVYGKLQGWKEYFQYVTGQAGDEGSLQTDQLNVLGNGYGTYQLEVNKTWNKFKMALYISHPFDDRSGMELENYKDNLIGLFFENRKENSFLQNIVIEYFHTKNQSGKYHLSEAPEGEKHRRGRDDYFNHGIYKSGVTYHKMAMCSPLFAPVTTTSNGLCSGFESTRFAGFHAGAKGYINNKLQWQGMFTYSNNFGKYNSKGITSYNPSRKLLATMAQVKYTPAKIPLSIALSLAVDHGSLFDQGKSTTRTGGMISIKYQILNK